MKKLFTSFVVASTVTSFAACGKKADAKTAPTKETKSETKTEPKKESKTSVVTKGAALKGTYKLGYVSSNPAMGNIVKSIVGKYSQDVLDKSKVGDEYFNLPSGLFLSSSDEFNAISSSKDGTTKKALSDKTKLASKNIDTLFIHVSDEVENSSDVYKTVVEKKEFKNTKLFFVGKKAKAQSGASSKVFAGGNVSTASFNQYATAYIAGFQAAVGAIKYSGSEDVYEETTVSFLIGSDSESQSKKKAFAFRRGVEAAAAHSAYSKYLKVKFVSKTEDSSSSSKRLYREISEWKSKDDGKYKLYEFSSADSFSDAERRIVYIAGATAADWRGKIGDHDFDNVFKKGDDIGLIGAMYNYGNLPETTPSTLSTLTSKTFTRGVWIILDKVSGKTATTEKPTSTTFEKDYLDYDADSTSDGGLTKFERHQVKFYGALGSESLGLKNYVISALEGQYMGGPNYMMGKHTIYGGQLDLSYVTHSYSGNNKASSPFIIAKQDGSKSIVKGIWNQQGGKDTALKAKSRYGDSLINAISTELTEAELTKASPWLK